MDISDEARKLNGLMLEVWACTKPHPEVTPEMLRKLLGRCLPFIRAAACQGSPPIDMLLFCPNCGMQHVDAAEQQQSVDGIVFPVWDNPPHKSHLCHGCGCVWRPADVPTNGVTELKTAGKADTWKVQPGPMSGSYPVSDRALDAAKP